MLISINDQSIAVGCTHLTDCCLHMFVCLQAPHHVKHKSSLPAQYFIQSEVSQVPACVDKENKQLCVINTNERKCILLLTLVPDSTLGSLFLTLHHSSLFDYALQCLRRTCSPCRWGGPCSCSSPLPRKTQSAWRIQSLNALFGEIKCLVKKIVC